VSFISRFDFCYNSRNLQTKLRTNLRTKLLPLLLRRWLSI